MYFITTIFTFLLSFNGFCETLYSYKDQNHHFFELYNESELWTLEHFIIEPSKLQKKKLKKSFLLKNDLYLFLKEYQKSLKIRSFKKNIKLHTLSQTEIENKNIWEAKNKWSLEWEDKYISWLENNFDKNFYQNYNIETDCADVAFSLRWIFSRINFLPAANTLAGSRVLFTHESMKKSWEKLPTHTLWYKDQRFLKALSYIMDNAYTKTLYIDTYPIEINKESFKVGTIQLLGGHTKIVSNIDETGLVPPINLLSSTVPSKVRELYEEMFIDSKNVSAKKGGMLRMRWPIKKNGKWTLIPKKEMPYYSTEQYEEDFIKESGNFALSIIKRIESKINLETIVRKSLEDLEKMLLERENIVNQGYDYCRSRSCESGSIDYENWSTPSRDKRILDSYKSILDLKWKLSNLFNEAEALFEKEIKDKKVIIEGKEYFLEKIIKAFASNWISSHPKDKPQQRWALDNESAEQSLINRKNRYLEKRKKLVIAASICRDSKEKCKYNSKEWKELETLQIDVNLKNIYNGYSHLCLDKDINTCNSHLFNDFYRLPFLISNPNYSTEKRNATNILKDDIKLLPHGQMSSFVNNNIVIINQSKIYNISQKKYIKLRRQYSRIDFLGPDKGFLANNELEVYWISPTFKEILLEKNLSGFLSKPPRVSFKENQFFIEFYNSKEESYFSFYSINENNNLKYQGKTSIWKVSSNLIQKFNALIIKEDSEYKLLSLKNGRKLKIISENENPYLFINSSWPEWNSFIFSSNNKRYFFDIDNENLIRIDNPNTSSYMYRTLHKINDRYFAILFNKEEKTFSLVELEKGFKVIDTILTFKNFRELSYYKENLTLIINDKKFFYTFNTNTGLKKYFYPDNMNQLKTVIKNIAIFSNSNNEHLIQNFVTKQEIRFNEYSNFFARASSDSILIYAGHDKDYMSSYLEVLNLSPETLELKILQSQKNLMLINETSTYNSRLNDFILNYSILNDSILNDPILNDSILNDSIPYHSTINDSTTSDLQENYLVYPVGNDFDLRVLRLKKSI